MKVRVDQETGYLIIEDIVEGIEILSKRCYSELEASAKEVKTLREKLSEFEDMKIKLKDLNEELIAAKSRSDIFNDDLNTVKQENKDLLIQNGELRKENQFLKMIVEVVKNAKRKGFYTYEDVKETRSFALKQGVWLGYCHHEMLDLGLLDHKDEFYKATELIVKRHEEIPGECDKSLEKLRTKVESKEPN